MASSATHESIADSPVGAPFRTARAAWSTPVTWILAAAIAGAASWEAHVLTVLRFGGPVLGPVIQAFAWVLLYVVLLLVVSTIHSAPAESARRLSMWLGIALVMALASVHLVRTVGVLVPRNVWGSYWYLRLLLPLVLAALWCAALLPRETRQAAWGAARRESIAPAVALVALFLLAAALVSVSDLAFSLVRPGTAVQRQLSGDVIGQTAWLSTTVILFLVLTLAFAVTSSATTAALLISPIYATMLFATLVKIRYMHSAVQPLDLLTLPEFMPLFGSFFGGSAIVVSVIGIALWLVALTVAWRRMRTPLSVRRRAALGLGAALLLTGLVGAFLPPQRLPDRLATRSAALRRLTTTLGAPVSEFKEMARAHGIVLSFLSELPSAFVAEPREYSKAQVERTIRAYTRDGPSATATTRRGGVSLVIYLVESMMDPRDLGVRFTSDPMPNFRAATASHPHGRAIVPHAFGGSANTEFELLTGMTNSFLPNGSIPYRQYVGRRVPALPHLLHDLGYTTTAIQADKRYYYDRERVYPLLGFDRSLWLHDEPVRDLAPRGGWPSDESIVDAVIQASQQSHPFFVFAFPSSSHSPYDFGTFTRSDLTVLDAPSRAGAAELQEYANAVRLSDRAVGRLIEYFRGRSDSTIVAVLGDHLPPLSSEALRVFSQRLARLSAPGRALAERAVPLVVWANFTLPREEITLSTNMLPGYLLERMGVPPSTLFAITDSIRRTLPVVGMVVESTDGRIWSRDSVPATLSGPLDDYRRVQYDLLLGEGFALSRRR